MNDARIERALRQGPPEPAYRPVDLGALLSGRSGGITMSMATRRVLGGAVVIASAAVIVTLVVILGFRPNNPPLVGGATSTPTAVPTVAPTALAPTPSPSLLVSPTPPLTTNPPSTPVPSPSSSASTATGCELTWSVSGVEGAAGSRYINIEATNAGTQTCTFAAMVPVTLQATDGSVIAQSDLPNSPAVMLDPGKKSSGFTQWTNWCGPQAPTHLRLIFNVDTTISPVNEVDFVADTPPCMSPGQGSAITPLTLGGPQ